MHNCTLAQGYNLAVADSFCRCFATSLVYRLLICRISIIKKMKYEIRNVRENESWCTPSIAIKNQIITIATTNRTTIVPKIIPTKRENSFLEAKLTDQYPATAYNTANTKA